MDGVRVACPSPAQLGAGMSSVRMAALRLAMPPIRLKTGATPCQSTDLASG